MSKSNISEKNKYLLWVLSGGRCQYRGCNRSLTQDILTRRNFNQAYIAHIVADVPGGPRGCTTRSAMLGDDINNLMLLCDTHHRLIDKHDVAGHSEDLLKEMKKEHEERIERLTAIGSDMKSHIVTYKANVGVNSPVITYESVREYLLPDHYPAQSSAIELGLTNSPQRDIDTLFWQTELNNLETQVAEQLRPKIRRGEITHFSLFALAPMPLLMRLGTLLNDIQNIEIHQPVRNPKTWNLSNDQEKIQYLINRPTVSSQQPVVLNISLSATITNDRISQVLGEDCSIYTITIPTPSNDYLKNKVHLEDFSIVVRQLFNEIKAVHGQLTELHIFPAMPVAAAIEFGRIWMPKADMPLIIYDQNTALGGFVKAVEIRNN